MEAIEVVTAKKRTRLKPASRGGDGKETETVLVWNPTVANLTLLALGASTDLEPTRRFEPTTCRAAARRRSAPDVLRTRARPRCAGSSAPEILLAVIEIVVGEFRVRLQRTSPARRSGGGRANSGRVLSGSALLAAPLRTSGVEWRQSGPVLRGRRCD